MNTRSTTSITTVQLDRPKACQQRHLTLQCPLPSPPTQKKKLMLLAGSRIICAPRSLIIKDET